MCTLCLIAINFMVMSFQSAVLCTAQYCAVHCTVLALNNLQLPLFTDADSTCTCSAE